MIFAVIVLTGCRNPQREQGTLSWEEETTAKSGQTVGSENAKTVLRWAVWDIPSITCWKALAEAYTCDHPDIRIEMTDLGSADYSAVLATELSVIGTEYDVVTVKDMPGYETLVAKEAVEPLEDRAERDHVDLEPYQEIEDQIFVEEGLYQMPFRKDFWVLYYNKRLFDEAGVAYPDNDMTVAEYDRLARQVTVNSPDQKVYGAHYHTWRSTVQLFGILDGKHSILDGNYDFTKPYYEMVKEQEKDGVCRSYVDTNVSQLHYSAAFAAGNTAMMNMGSWYINTLLAGLETGDYRKDLCGDWGIVRYPHPEGVEAGTTLGVVTGLAIPSGSKQKEEAWDFIKFAASEQGARIIAETGTLPAIMSEEVIDILTGLEGFPQDQESREALTTGRVYPEAPYDSRISEINTILDEYHKDIMDGSISIDAGIQKMNEEVE